MKKQLSTRADLGLGHQALPENIECQMRFYRTGSGGMPESYIAWHLERADEALNALLGLCPGLRLVEQKMCDGAFLNGMKELHVIVETPSGQTLKLVYFDQSHGFIVTHRGRESMLYDTDLA